MVHGTKEEDHMS